jgi:hypothetical protein
VPALVDIATGKTPAAASDLQQIIDLLTGRRDAPVSIINNSAVSPTLTLKNSAPGGDLVVMYAADGTTVLFAVGQDGVVVSRTGGAAETPLTQLGPASGQAAEGTHVHGAGGYTGTGAVTLEALYDGTWVVTAVNYGSGGSFGANVLFVFCTAGVTVTLPSAATTKRPITVVAITGSTTVASAAGSVIGGSVNTTTGAVMNGTVSPGDSITYKSDGTSWRAV